MNTVKLPELKGCPFCGCEMRVESNRDWHCLIGDHGPSCIFTDNEPATGSWPATDEALDEMAAFWNARAAVEASDLLPVLDLLRTDRNGKKWDYVQSHSGSMVNVSQFFTPPAPKAEAVEANRGEAVKEWKRRYFDRCSVIFHWHEKSVALGYDGVNDLLELALPCIVNNAGEERPTNPSVAVTEANENASVLAAIKFLRPEYEAWSKARKSAFDRIITAALSQGGKP